MKDSFKIYRTSPWEILKAVSCLLMALLLFAYCLVKSTYTIIPIAIGYFILGFIFIFNKNRTDKVYIEVDKNGIWLEQQQITTWQEFINISIVDSFQSNENKKSTMPIGKEINITHYKENELGFFIYKVNFGGTEDKTENEFVDATFHFYKKYQELNDLINNNYQLR